MTERRADRPSSGPASSTSRSRSWEGWWTTPTRWRDCLPVRARLSPQKYLTKIPKVGPILAPIAIPALAKAVKLSKSKLEEIHAQALADRDFLTAVVTQFRLDLAHGVEDRLFVKSLW